MVRVAFLTVVAALVVAAPAHAATAALGGTGVTFQAAPKERNVLSIVHETGAVVLRDAGALITPGAGCAAIEGGVRCSSEFVVAHLGDGDDVATADRLANHGLSAFIYGEAGNDRISGGEGMFSGGPGDDVVTGTALLDEDGPTPGHDTYVGVARTFIDGTHGATLSYQTRTDDIRADLRAGHRGEDRISGVSDLRGGKGDDVLIGDGQPNVISGQDGYDRVLGFDGNDRLDGEDVGAGAGDDQVSGGRESIAPRCGTGKDVVIASGFSLVGSDCERVRAGDGSAQPRRGRMPDARAAFLVRLPSCTRCQDERWQAKVHGRVVASAGASPLGSLHLNAEGRRLLRRERSLRVHVTHRYSASGVEGGRFPKSEAFRIDLRL